MDIIIIQIISAIISQNEKNVFLINKSKNSLPKDTINNISNIVLVLILIKCKTVHINKIIQIWINLSNQTLKKNRLSSNQPIFVI